MDEVRNRYKRDYKRFAYTIYLFKKKELSNIDSFSTLGAKAVVNIQVKTC